MKRSNQISHLLISLFFIQALSVGLPAINSLLNSFIIGHFLGSSALAAKSMELVTPAFYDITLRGSKRDFRNAGLKR